MRLILEPNRLGTGLSVVQTGIFTYSWRNELFWKDSRFLLPPHD